MRQEHKDLHIKMRPWSIKDLAPTSSQFPMVQSLINDRTIPKVMVMNGPSGSGKTTLANIVTAAIHCEASSNQPCMQCPPCGFAKADIERGTDYGYVMSLNASTEVGVRAIADLEERVTDQNYALNNKVVIIINEAQALKKPSMQALLPVLEHGNNNVHWIFTTMEEGFMQGSTQLEAAFRRRATFVRFSMLNEHASKEYAVSVLKSLGFPATDEIVERVSSSVPAMTLKNIEVLAAIDFNLEEYERSITNVMPGVTDKLSFNDDLVNRVMSMVNSTCGDRPDAKDLILSILRDIIERHDETDVDALRQRVCYSTAKTITYFMKSKPAKLPGLARFIKLMEGEGINSSRYYALVADLTLGFMELSG